MEKNKKFAEEHGPMEVKNGYKIVGRDSGERLSLAGMSYYWSNPTTKGEQSFNDWHGHGNAYYNPWTVTELKDKWNAKIVRVALGVGEMDNNYLELPMRNFDNARTVINAAIAEGIYVIIDWHAHNTHETTVRRYAADFFRTMAKEYGHFPNVIFEIYNEPTEGVTWDQVKDYANEIIPIIREHSDNLIVCGTPNYSQNIDEAEASPLNDKNTAYTLHFYGSEPYHYENVRPMVEEVLYRQKIAVMVTEWGTPTADGGPLEPNRREDEELFNSSWCDDWMDLCARHRLCHCNWAVSDAKEVAAIVKTGTEPQGEWTQNDLTDSGFFVQYYIENWDEKLEQTEPARQKEYAKVR